MNVTNAQLRRLVATDPSDLLAREELRHRTKWAAIRRLPARTGTLDGVPVIEDKGSGYWCFRDGGGALTQRSQYDRIVYDEPTKRERNLRALIDALEGYQTPRTFAEARALLSQKHRKPFKMPALIVDNPPQT